MRLWRLHPSYLDAKGLVAVWREGLLAKKVLENRTRGYQHHPQSARFRAQADPLAAIQAYLHEICVEAARRGYQFDASKLAEVGPQPPIPLTTGQLLYEFEHLKRKLVTRDPRQFHTLEDIAQPIAHPLFSVAPGEVAGWEKR